MDLIHTHAAVLFPLPPPQKKQDNKSKSNQHFFKELFSPLPGEMIQSD